MNRQAMQDLLETRLRTLGWSTQTAWENVAFKPTVGTAYQEVTTAFAESNPITLANSSHLQGVFQVRLLYPPGIGTMGANIRAKAIAYAFPRNLVLSNADAKVKIMREAHITGGEKQGDRAVTVIRIRFSDR